MKPPTLVPAAPKPATAATRFRVLVVDDDEGMLRTISNVLSDDVSVMVSSSAHRALELLGSNSFHVVCSDYKMPGMNGLELLRAVSKLPQFASCLLLTGSSDYQTPEDILHYVHVLLKPFDPARLITMVLQLARVAEMKRSVNALATSVGKKPAQ